MRRKYIVDVKFQWTVIGYTLLISLLTSAVHITISELFVIDRIQNLTSISVLHFIGPKTAICLLVIFFYASIFAIGVLFSNRLAGALYRLRRHMLAIAKGEPAAPMNFRPNDYFSELNGAYNELLRSLPPERKLKSGDKGFALMELMIVVAIIGIMSAMGVVFYASSGQSFLSFNQDTSNLQGILMAGRNAAITMNECTQVKVINPQLLTVTGFPATAPCAGPFPPSNLSITQAFASTSTVSVFSTGNTLTFQPGGGTTAPSPVTITLTGPSSTVLFTIYPAIGQVRHL